MALIFIFGLPILLILLILMAQFTLSIEMVESGLQVSSLESGFESLKMKMAIGSPFLFLAMLFVLFDLELIILVPGIFFSSKTPMEGGSWLLIVTIILMTLALEWHWCGLKWYL